MTDQTSRKGYTARLVFPGSGVEIPIPDVPEDEAHAGDTESEAVAAHPAFQAMMERANRDIAEGRTKPAEQVYRELGIGEPSYDTKTDTAYVPLADGPYGHTVEEPHRTIDYTEGGAVFGVEFRAAARGVDLSGLPEADAREGEAQLIARAEDVGNLDVFALAKCAVLDAAHTILEHEAVATS